MIGPPFTIARGIRLVCIVSLIYASFMGMGLLSRCGRLPGKILDLYGRDGAGWSWAIQTVSSRRRLAPVRRAPCHRARVTGIVIMVNSQDRGPPSYPYAVCDLSAGVYAGRERREGRSW